MATEKPFFWALAGPFIPRYPDIDSKELGRWEDVLLHPNSKPRALPSSTDDVSQGAQIFLAVVVLPGKECFRISKTLMPLPNAWTRVCALSLLL